MADTRIYPSERSCSEKESTLKTIATCDLRKEDVPQGNFNWPKFSKFALTFDPLSEIMDEFDQVPASAIPSNTWTTVALRYFLYCWQRIGNNQGELKPAAIDNIQAALRILHSKT
jgi:hypothetical protein